MAVHTQCYVVTFIPSGDWYCRVCSAKRDADSLMHAVSQGEVVRGTSSLFAVLVALTSSFFFFVKTNKQINDTIIDHF